MLVPPSALIASIALISSGASPSIASTATCAVVEKVMRLMRSPGSRPSSMRSRPWRAYSIGSPCIEPLVSMTRLRLSGGRSSCSMSIGGVHADQHGDAVGAGDHVAHLTEQAVQAHVVGALGVRQLDLVLVEEADVVDGVGAGDVALIEDVFELAEVLRAALADAEAAAAVAVLAAAGRGGAAAVVVGALLVVAERRLEQADRASSGSVERIRERGEMEGFMAGFLRARSW
jgi:hypothetical protein